MKKGSKRKRIRKIVLSIFAVIVVGIIAFLIRVAPGKQPEDMLFDVGMYNPISLVAFSGNGYASSVVGHDDVYNVPSMLNISFKPEVRTRWHTHDGGQILICTYGKGYYQVEGEEVQILRAGDVVLIEPNVKHWHGAGPDGWFSHIAISTNPGNSASHFLEDITDDYYQTLTGVEFNERIPLGYSEEALKDLKEGAMFPIGETYDYEGYASGTIYKTSLIPNEDIFNFPSTDSMSFEPGSKTDWMSHEGGQILIALGGEGQVQIEGEEIVHLQPTDVIEIKPGDKFWYGSENDRWFSVIRIDTNPNHPGVEWFE